MAEASTSTSKAARLSQRWVCFVASLFSPEPAAALAIFRMLWGGLMAWESWRYYIHGWTYRYYVEPTFLFKYPGFEWVEALPGPGITAVSIALVVAGVLISIGLLYRLASALFFVAHTYVFLLGAANYLNHAYLISLLAGLMILVPAHRTLSVDALLRPKIAASVVPAWPRALILVQLGIVYVYGALAKLNVDWIVYHQPIRRWMKGSARRVVKTPWIRQLESLQHSIFPDGVPVTERLHDFVASEQFTVFVAYGGVLFDLLIAPALAWKKTRRLAVVAAVGFHVSNMHLFSIGVFPWLMLAATTLFLSPDWAFRLPKLGARVERVVTWMSSRGPGVRAMPKRAGMWAQLWVAYLLVQLLIPLRHHLYPGDVAWTEEGHVCSWRMKLRSKRGSVRFRVVDIVTHDTWTVDPATELTKRQARKIRGKPELIRQYANHLVDRYREDEGKTVNVYVDAMTALNYREPQPFIDPDFELGHEPASLGPYGWVLPMTWSLPPHPGETKP
ncbi:MAG: HTTM domain-containing protein [Nannocystaceae bacterium]|nr:HTTM domain-containing protein [Nannocystaceae bacterium]